MGLTTLLLCLFRYNVICLQGARLRFPPGCPVQYEALALSCMEADPANRPTVEHVLRELEAMRTTIL